MREIDLTWKRSAVGPICKESSAEWADYIARMMLVSSKIRLGVDDNAATLNEVKTLLLA